MLNVIFFSLIGGLFSFLGAVFLLRSRKTAYNLARYATPFAAGVLLATAFINLIPEAIDGMGDVNVPMTAVLLGILGFFMLERYLRWFHHHHEHNTKEKASNSLVIIGDTLHNALDGVAIGAAFLISPSTGIITAMAVALHEIPQEIGDFGIMLRNGMKRKNVLIVNVLSALSTTIAAVFVYYVGDSDSAFIPYLLAVTAGFFIYIATSDIIPEIHETINGRQRDIRPWLLLLGAVLVMIISPIAHEYIDVGHDEEHNSSQVTHEEEHDDEEHNQ
jgi:zinc and cadmium transporter